MQENCLYRTDYCDHCNNFTLVFLHRNYSSEGEFIPFIFCERCFDYIVKGGDYQICSCVRNDCPCFKDVNEHGEIGCVAPLKQGETMCERCINYQNGNGIGDLISSFQNL